MLSHFDTIPERDGQTDRQTDGQTDMIATSISHISTPTYTENVPVDVIYGSVHESGTLRVAIGNKCSSSCHRQQVQ